MLWYVRMLVRTVIEQMQKTIEISDTFEASRVDDLPHSRQFNSFLSAMLRTLR